MMAQKIGEVDLDLSKVVLEGWENVKHSPKIARYVSMNLSGSKAPKVNVVKRNGIYQLFYCDDLDFLDGDLGGHRRSVSHYVSKQELSCNLYDEHLGVEKFKQVIFSPIQDIKIRMGFFQKTINYLKDFPEDVFSRFIKMVNFRSVEDEERFYDALRESISIS